MDNNRVIKAAILGAGTVGSGVYKLSQMMAGDFKNKTGAELEIKKVLVRSLKKEREGIIKDCIAKGKYSVVELNIRLYEEGYQILGNKGAN